MNKKLILPALALLTALSFTSCKDDTQPRLQTPPANSFKIFEPAMNNYIYYLTPETTIEIVTSQPEYGLGVVTSYEVQVSLDGKFEDAVTDKEGNITKEATYRTLPTIGNQAKIQILGKELATAMCSMHGINVEEDADKWDNPAINGVQPVHVRVHAFIPDPKEPSGYAPGSSIISDPIVIKRVQPYFAVNVPKIIYLIGNPQGWDVANGDMPLSEAENGIGSDIYTGHYNVSQDDLGGGGLRFYKELGDWGKDGQYPSIGAAAADGENVEVPLDPETFEASIVCVAGKGNFEVTGWHTEKAWMKFTVNLVNMTVSFGPGEAQPEPEE